jgi:hypothetical protein
MTRWTAIAVIVGLFLASNVAYLAYDYFISQPKELAGGTCVLPAVYRGKPQQEIDLLVSRTELKFATKSASSELPPVPGSEQMLVAEFMSCQYEKRNPSLKEDQKTCYRAFILSVMQPQQRTIYENCTQRDVFSRHLGQLRSLASLLARSPNSPLVLDLDDKAKSFSTDEVQAPNNELLVRRICDIYAEKISCTQEAGTMRIRVK